VRLLLCALAAILAASAPAAAAYHPPVKLGATHTHGGFPDLRAASAGERANGRVLLWTMRRVARLRFPTLAAARSLGYRKGPRSSFIGMELRRPGVRSPFVHYRNAVYDRDGRVLDPERPEALVYWQPRGGEPVLVGFMFRAPSLQPAPDPHGVGSLLNWHAHAACDPVREPGNALQFATDRCSSGIAHHGATQMTHVWLARDLRTGFAGSVPARELGIYIAGIPALYDTRPDAHDHAAAGHDHGRGAAAGRDHEHAAAGHHHHGRAVELTAAEVAVADAWTVTLLVPLAALLLLARGPVRQAGLRLLAIAGLAAVAAAHVEDLGGHIVAAPYLGVLFCALILACGVLAVALGVGWRPGLTWMAVVAIAVATIAAYVVSRTAGLPQIGDHVGDWGEPAAIVALAAEAAVAAVGIAALSARR
jgi:hypothetical protein